LNVVYNHRTDKRMSRELVWSWSIIQAGRICHGVDYKQFANTLLHLIRTNSKIFERTIF